MVGEIFTDKGRFEGGKVENHIKPLARVDPKKYAMSITTVSGQRCVVAVALHVGIELCL